MLPERKKTTWQQWIAFIVCIVIAMNHRSKNSMSGDWFLCLHADVKLCETLLSVQRFTGNRWVEAYRNKKCLANRLPCMRQAVLLYARVAKRYTHLT